MPRADINAGTISVGFDVAAYVSDLRALTGNMELAARHALFVVARELLKDARLYVPVLTGRLRDSGRVEGFPTVDQAQQIVQVVYGGELVAYAIKQHEESYRHASLGFTGPAKYLEKPLLANFRFYQVLFATEVQIALRRQYRRSTGTLKVL